MQPGARDGGRPGKGMTSEERNRLLVRIAHELDGTLNLEDVLGRLLDTLRAAVGYDAAGIFVLNREEVFPGYGLSWRRIAATVRRGFGGPLPDLDRLLAMGQGLVGHVLQTGEPALAADVRLDPRYIMGRPATRSELAVPVYAGGRLVGAMNLESDDEGAYCEEDAETLRLFADAAAIAVEKAILYRLFVQKERLEEELRLALEAGEESGPALWHGIPGWDAAGLTRPRYEIGGDYFDRIALPDGRLGLVVADVSGKGSLAAMTLTTFRAILRTQVEGEPEPVRTAAAANRLLRERVGPTEYVTALYGVLDPGRGHFAFSNCGHAPPLLVRADGRYTKLTTGGPPLGLLAGARYLAGEVTIDPGDLLVLFTDGVVEAEGPDGAEFGVDRLAEVVLEVRDRPSARVIAAVARATTAHTGVDHFADDFTILVLKRLAEG
ncbi:MAG: GAF domain-containing SpoIIE family protein phosphatase [Thermoanaerobaculia bacterium]